jgi:hypothetical protein
MAEVHKLADSLKGLSLTEANQKVREKGYIVRVTSTDGRARFITADHNCRRINVRMDNDIITDIDMIG